jgi:hypothetical protein
MAFDVNGRVISSPSGGLSIGGALLADANGWVRGGSVPGFLGWKDIAGDEAYYQTDYVGWPVNVLVWNSGFSVASMAFVAPVAGFYLCGAMGIMKGGTGYPITQAGAQQTYGYFGWSRNNALHSFSHFNVMAQNAWEQGGIQSMIWCEAGDAIRFHINSLPIPSGPNSKEFNYGWYPHGEHVVWALHMG